MRILGLDFGDRNVGLALSDPLRLTAQPFGQHRLSDEAKDKKYFLTLVRQNDVEEIVIGFPLRMDGSSGTRAQKTREFAAWLEKEVARPVVFWDERLTTQQAQGIMVEQKINWKEKKKVEHQISAVLILQSYLDHKRNQDNAP
jgi:putative pre-16S rRNA nuclease